MIGIERRAIFEVTRKIRSEDKEKLKTIVKETKNYNWKNERQKGLLDRFRKQQLIKRIS